MGNSTIGGPSMKLQYKLFNITVVLILIISIFMFSYKTFVDDNTNAKETYIEHEAIFLDSLMHLNNGELLNIIYDLDYITDLTRDFYVNDRQENFLIDSYEKFSTAKHIIIKLGILMLVVSKK